MKKILMYSGLFLLLMLLGCLGISYASPAMRFSLGHLSGLFAIAGLISPLTLIPYAWPIIQKLNKTFIFGITGISILITMYSLWITIGYGCLRPYAHIIEINYNVASGLLGISLFFSILLNISLIKKLKGL